MKIEIDNTALNGYELPEKLEFGKVKTPLMLEADLTKDNPIPEIVNIHKTQNLSLDPFCNTLHYGQSIFEGLKAYTTTDGRKVLFRPEANMERLARSAKIMNMVDLDVNFLMECLLAYTKELKDLIPTTPGHSLYLRPLLFANDPLIKVKSGHAYKFLILSSVVGDYFASVDAKTKVLVSDKYVRALPGGTGEAKTAANYAQSLPALNYAQSLGYQQVIYVDAITRLFIEELGGMNFFWVENGVLCTPPLTGTILRGITRMSVLEIAKDLGYEVSEVKITVKGLLEKAQAGIITEAFACGTAAVMTPLNEIGVEVDGNAIENIKFETFPMMDKLKTYLLATQRGETEHSKKYLTEI
jgi:branched-chain amino acid aminotransferase